VLLAMVLLTIGATASMSLVRANVALTERVTFLAASRAVTRVVAEELQVSPCAAVAGAFRIGSTDIVWTPSSAAPAVTFDLVAQGAPHPSGLAAPRALAAQFAGWCP
jgi:hypothetical protein